jgi:hypothetical protein
MRRRFNYLLARGKNDDVIRTCADCGSMHTYTKLTQNCTPYDHWYAEEFEIVLGIQTDNGAILKHIPGEGLPINIANHGYVVLGSESAMMRTRTLFQPLWSRGLDMIKVGEFGYFFIRYVERYHLDDLIGIERDAKPQIWYIPNCCIYPSTVKKHNILLNCQGYEAVPTCHRGICCHH